jgi:hypothetical protein
LLAGNVKPSSRFASLDNEKKFDSMTREDVLDFLDSYRKRALEHKNDNLVDISGIDWDIEEWEIE